MGKSTFRMMVSGVLLLLSPSALLAADSNAAMLYASGGNAWVNGAELHRFSSVIFPGDILQTPSNSVAKITEPGSSIAVLSDSIVQFEESSLRVEHGRVSVSTAKGVGASAGDVKIAPASSSWTEFDVTDVDGTVRILARKGDLTVSDGQNTVPLAQGQETTRQESSDQSDKNKKKRKKGAGGPIVGVQGAILDNPVIIGLGSAAIVGVTTWVLLQGSEPVSPVKP